MADAIPNKLIALRDKFASTLPERARQINELWSMLRYQAWSDTGIQSLQMLAHRLVGTCGTFGYPAAGAAAAELESFLKETNESGQSFGGPERERIQRLVNELGSQLVVAEKLGSNAWPASIPEEESIKQRHETIFIVDDDHALTSLIEVHLKTAGYTVECFDHPSLCLQRLQSLTPSLIIMDLGFQGTPLLGIESIVDIKEITGGRLPILLLSARSDLMARLQALRAGAAELLSKPVDFTDLNETIQSLIKQQKKTLKVMLVDDEPLLLDLLSEQLQQANMQTYKVTQSMHTLQKAAQFQPDVIVLDIHMPKVNGIELATLLRNDKAFTLIPLVFLTSDQSSESRKAATRLGVTAFLNKPITGNELTTEIHRVYAENLALRHRVNRVTKANSSEALLNRSYFYSAAQQLLDNIEHNKNDALLYLVMDNIEILRERLRFSGMAELHEQFSNHIIQIRGNNEQWSILGDLIACALVSKKDILEAKTHAERVCRYFSQQIFTRDNEKIPLSVSIGVVPLQQAPASLDATLALAEKTCNIAKSQAHDHVYVHSAVKTDKILFPNKSKNLATDNFALAFQPIVNIDTNESNIYEVLIRYRLEDGELIPASHFMHEINLSDWRIELDRWVVQAAIQAFSQSPLIRESGTLIIHLSEDSLKQKTFLSFISNVIRNSRIRGQKRLFVVVDAVWANQYGEHTQFVVQALRSSGLGVCFNRVELVNSMIEMIKLIAPDVIKLTPESSTQLAKTQTLDAPFDALINACAEVNCQIVATQIEDAQALSTLYQKSLRLFQGYYIQAPNESVIPFKSDRSID